MNIPMKYEDVVAKLDAAEVIIQAGEHVESHLEKQIDILRIDLDSALAREAALREELAALRESYEAMRDRKNSIVDLQQRLTVAEQLLREVLESGDWFRSALEFINGEGFEVRAKIEAALKPAEGEGS